VEETLPMFEVLLQVEDAVIKVVDTKDKDVVLDINIVAITMPRITTARRMLLSMTSVVITVMHIHGKCDTAILMDQIIGQDFSLDHKVPQVVVVKMVDDSNLDMEMEAVVMTLTKMTMLLMRVSQLQLARHPLSQTTFL
jgi:hypothetical protein